eukprot:5095378-Alexandrium_andersonii.AAC.1
MRRWQGAWKELAARSVLHQPTVNKNKMLAFWAGNGMHLAQCAVALGMAVVGVCRKLEPVHPLRRVRGKRSVEDLEASEATAKRDDGDLDTGSEDNAPLAKVFKADSQADTLVLESPLEGNPFDSAAGLFDSSQSQSWSSQEDAQKQW